MQKFRPAGFSKPQLAQRMPAALPVVDASCASAGTCSMGVMVTQALSDNVTNWLQLLLTVCYAAWSGSIPLETCEMALPG
jgi:hypothetical protein